MIEIVLFYVIPAIICFILIYMCNAYAENENDKINFVGAMFTSIIPIFHYLFILLAVAQIASSEKKLSIDYWFMHSKRN